MGLPMSINFSLRLEAEKTPNKRRRIYEGKNKILFEGPSEDTFIIHFKDESNLGLISGKASISNRFSEVLMKGLEEIGVQTYFIERLNMREQLVRAVQPLPFSILIHRIAVGEWADSLGISSGTLLQEPIFEIILQSQGKPERVLSPHHLEALGWLDAEDTKRLFEIVRRVHDFLSGYFSASHLKLARCSVKFGQPYEMTFESQYSDFILTDALGIEDCYVINTLTNEHFTSESPSSGANFYQNLANIFSLFPENAHKPSST